jgi:transcriptional regulator with XRE-family HTH domain
MLRSQFGRDAAVSSRPHRLLSSNAAYRNFLAMHDSQPKGGTKLIAAQCKMARDALGLGVRELAERAKVSPDEIARLERGEELGEGKIDVVRAALEAAGVEFTIDGQLEVRLRAFPFFLKPIDPSDPTWRASIVHSGIWVAATSEKDAREKARAATVTLVSKLSGKLSNGSPWVIPDKATCQQRACPYPLKIGQVLTESGQRL